MRYILCFQNRERMHILHVTPGGCRDQMGRWRKTFQTGCSSTAGSVTHRAGLPKCKQNLSVFPVIRFEKWLPALFGYVIKDHETTSKLLTDWRKTLTDLVSKTYYGQMTKLAKNNRLSVAYETAVGDVVPGDILEYFKHADVPMCEFRQPLSSGLVGSLNFLKRSSLPHLPQKCMVSPVLQQWHLPRLRSYGMNIWTC
jgi:hypothetical protein